MAFEYVVVVAAITGRTLVLPPSQPWYLLHSGPMHIGAGRENCGFGDIFDIGALSETVATITTGDFVRLERARLGIPDSLTIAGSSFARGVAADNVKQLRQWQRWLLESACVIPWNPLESLVCQPGVEAVMRANVLTEPFVDQRELVEFTPAMNAAPVLHFPAHRHYRQLGQVAAMLACSDPEQTKQTRRLLKHKVRYVPRVFDVAAKLTATLSGHGYSALHVRRNDFQYSESRADSHHILNNIRGLLRDGEPLYIATDEADESFFDVFRKNRPVYRWADFLSTRYGEVLEHEALPHELIGPVEQLVCAMGRVFIGTELSTFSSYIVRLRGYMSAPDTNAYFHTLHYRRPFAGNASGVSCRGRDYLHESPSLWQAL